MYSGLKNGVSTPGRTVDEAMAKHTTGRTPGQWGVNARKDSRQNNYLRGGVDWVNVELYNNGNVPSCEK